MIYHFKALKDINSLLCQKIFNKKANDIRFGLVLWPWILRCDGLFLIWDITSSPRGVEPPSTKQLELQTSWDKGGILQPVLS